MVLLGYEPGAKAYRVYDPAVRRVHVSRDVLFYEVAGWPWSDTEEEMCHDFVVDAAWEMLHEEMLPHAAMTPAKVTTTLATPVSTPSATLVQGGLTPATATSPA